MEKLSGRISSYKAITKTRVQLELLDQSGVVELQVSEPWVINRSDEVIIVGERDPKSGKFIGYAYRNITKGVFGKYSASVGTGWVFVIMGVFFFWAIFPLFSHVPAGIKQIALGKRVNQAFALLMQD